MSRFFTILEEKKNPDDTQDELYATRNGNVSISLWVPSYEFVLTPNKIDELITQLQRCRKELS